MFLIASLSWLASLLVTSVTGPVIGVLLSFFLPITGKNPTYRYTPAIGLGWGVLAGIMTSAVSSNRIAAWVAGFLFAYFASRFSASLNSWLATELALNLKEVAVKPIPTAGSAEPATPGHVLFRREWDARPRYEPESEDGEAEQGLFVGRTDGLHRLTSDFISKRSGTILISGVRGVGKTALVERALLDARSELQNRYWNKACETFKDAPWWRPIDRRVLEELSRYVETADPATTPANAYLVKKKAAAKYSRQPARWYHRFSPTDRLIRRLHRASRSQLFVLKFNASDIGGAMAEPDDDAGAGRPNVNPEKLLRALIRKLFMTCHSSRRTIEAEILRWSLRNKKERTQFFETLQTAYDKSVSKSYKEIINNSVNEALKRSESSSSERTFTLDRIIGLGVSLLVGAAFAWWGSKQGWRLVVWFAAGGGATAVATYFTWKRTAKNSQEILFDRARQAQFSYEFDYSLARMEYDLEAILSILREPRNRDFDRYRCFKRKVIIFDELDKLENPIQQLNDVITHFKNFFTLSDALFVFITDHQFFEHLEGTRAQQKRHYSEEHTFFTQKLYVRKPDFEDFNETVYRFCDTDLLERRVRSGDLDSDLLEFLRRDKPGLFEPFEGWSEVAILTHLYLNRDKYGDNPKREIETAFNSVGLKDLSAVAQVWAATIIDGANTDSGEITRLEAAFQTHGGLNNPLAVAQIWTAKVSAGNLGADWRRQFIVGAQGWKDPEAVAFLHRHRYRFSASERDLISTKFKNFPPGVMEKYTGVDRVPFTLSDLARALCFQTRNHYFDLYHLVYDYVGSYADGVPLLHMGEDLFTREHRLWSRYQQLVQAAFKYRHEDHPSREYFNAVMMEALYSAFDTRALDKPVKISDILFTPDKNSAALIPPEPVSAKTTPKTAAKKAKPPVRNPSAPAPGRNVLTITPREAEKINQAILRLLRIAGARKAIKVDGDFEKQCELTNGNLAAISNLSFTWEPDCEPVITQEGLDPESHEKELIKFWQDNQTELEGLDRELDRAWANVELPKDSAVRRMKDLNAMLKLTAEGLRRRDITSISQYDARKLKADIGTPETWITATLDLILERIRAEGDADIIDSGLNQETWTALPLLSGMTFQPSEVEKIRNLPTRALRAVIRPKASDCLIYFVGGAMPPSFALNELEEAIPKSDRHLFWYAPGIDPTELQAQPATDPAAEPNSPTSVRFYFPPPAPDSISKLIADYGLLASTARLQKMAAASTSDYQRFGMELFAPLTGLSDLNALLSNADLPLALQKLDELPAQFKVDPVDFWSSYEVAVQPNWSPPEVAKAITRKLTSTFQLQPSSLLPAIEKVIREGLSSDFAKVSASLIFNTSIPNSNARSLLRRLLEELAYQRLAIARIEDQNLKERLTKDFVASLLTTIDTIVSTRKVALDRIPSWSAQLIAELEKQRMALRTT